MGGSENLTPPKALNIPWKPGCWRQAHALGLPSQQTFLKADKERVLQLNPVLEVAQQAALGRKQKKALIFMSSCCVTVTTDYSSRLPYLCFLMPLESASPPPQSFPSDILCFPLLTGALLSSKECAVTASRQVRDPSDSEPVAEQAHGECTEHGRKASLTMVISLKARAVKFKQPTLSFPNPQTPPQGFQRTRSHGGSHGFMWQMYTYIKLQLNWFYILRGSQRLLSSLRNHIQQSPTPKFLFSSFSRHLN